MVVLLGMYSLSVWLCPSTQVPHELGLVSKGMSGYSTTGAGCCQTAAARHQNSCISATHRPRLRLHPSLRRVIIFPLLLPVTTLLLVSLAPIRSSSTSGRQQLEACKHRHGCYHTAPGTGLEDSSDLLLIEVADAWGRIGVAHELQQIADIAGDTRHLQTTTNKPFRHKPNESKEMTLRCNRIML